jgi:hypothetical protein
MHVCLLCVIIFGRQNRMTSVRRKEKSSNIKRKRTRDRPLKASHLLVASLNPIITLCIVFTTDFQYALFPYCYCSYIAIVGDLAPQVDCYHP